MAEHSCWNSKRQRTGFSVYLSGLLRHSQEKVEPEKRITLDMDIHGWVSVEELLEKINQVGEYTVTREMLEEVVATDEKGRYRFDSDGTRIKACQGHSIAWVEPELTIAEPPKILYHGTNSDALVQIILSGGISRMERHAVHLQADEEAAWKSARRWKGKHPVVLCIDAERMAADGIEFGVSENKVWCCESVPHAYIIRTLRMSEAERLALATWNEKNYKKYLAQLKQDRENGKEAVTHKLFYINPMGTVAQNDLLVAFVINYARENVKRDYLAETILSWEKPFFWVEGMSETQPGSGEFSPVRFDLIKYILEKKDAQLLRKFYDKIDLDACPQHREGIEALMKE